MRVLLWDLAVALMPAMGNTIVGLWGTGYWGLA